MPTRFVGRTGLLSLIIILIAAIHGAVLKSAVESINAGDSFPLVGEDFHEGQTVSLVLVGVFDQYSLGEATANDEGGFTIDFLVPVDTRPGKYQVVAYDSNGERTAALDITVLEATIITENHENHKEGVGQDEINATPARADDMTIERSMSGAGWGIVGLLIGITGGLGIAMLRGTSNKNL